MEYRRVASVLLIEIKSGTIEAGASVWLATSNAAKSMSKVRVDERGNMEVTGDLSKSSFIGVMQV